MCVRASVRARARASECASERACVRACVRGAAHARGVTDEGTTTSAACHLIPHVCQVCGLSFTALTNSSTACKVHPLINIVVSDPHAQPAARQCVLGVATCDSSLGSLQVVGSKAHATHTHTTFIWECCPDKPHTCVDVETFKAKDIPHNGSSCSPRLLLCARLFTLRLQRCIRFVR